MAASGLVSAAPSASALPTATISRSIFLAASSNGFASVPGAPNGMVGRRSIFLAAGKYTWGYNISNPSLGGDSNERVITLARATYQWDCGIQGTGASYPAINYLTFCELFPEVPNPKPVFIPAQANMDDRLALPSGTWTWQSFLIPDF
ncbi:MAG TPA: hypothetical protein VH637_03500 [Streptosporangiaceae bacterium]